MGIKQGSERAKNYNADPKVGSCFCFLSPELFEVGIFDTLDTASSGVPSPFSSSHLFASPPDMVVKDPGHGTKQTGLGSNASSAILFCDMPSLCLSLLACKMGK